MVIMCDQFRFDWLVNKVGDTHESAVNILEREGGEAAFGMPSAGILPFLSGSVEIEGDKTLPCVMGGF